MRGLISAIRFMSILPLGKSDTFEPRTMAQFFPVVGIFLGLLIAVFDTLVSGLWSKQVASLLDVIVLLVVTGAFHVDGLGDTADGLLGHRTKHSALAIMKDSRIGAMGLVAIVCGLSLKWAGITGLEAHRPLLLIIIPSYARAGQLFGLRSLEYGRPEGGTACALFGNPLQLREFWALTIPVLLSLWLGWRGLWLNMAFVLITFGILSFYRRRIGCVTGDMLGAMTEITESLLFLLVSIGGTA